MHLKPRDFLLRLALCQGLSCRSKYRLWKASEQCYDFDHPIAMADRAGLSVRAHNALATNWPSQELEADVELNRTVPFISLVDPDYPLLLKASQCPPIGFWYRGNPTILRRQCLSVVGARQMSPYSASVLKGILPAVIKTGVVIVSGLAKGVDGLSHELTLRSLGLTIAVVGCGLDRCYPSEHQHLMDQIAQSGLVISEYPLGTAPLPWHFPERNRIIAGLSETLLVTEARQKSGSLITANLALNDNRNICAIPGRIDAPLSVGTNALIAEGAVPITCAQDLLDQFTASNFRLNHDE